MADLTPRTRSESFLNGEDLEPITRREHFYAGRENELPEGHQEPKTREEWFIQKYREAGDVTVESLSITENGTYTAPSGKAYSPVSVNVPLPSNAYLLKSIENVNIATFTDGTDNFLKSLEVAIEPVQSGSGDPSPTNIRPISGWTACNVVRTGKNLLDSSTANIEQGTIDSSTGEPSYASTRIRSKYIFLKKGIYTLSNSTFRQVIDVYDLNKSFIASESYVNWENSTFTFTLSGDKYVRFLWSKSNNADITPSELANAQLEIGETATTYIAYSAPNTYTINFVDGSNPLTVYGGTLDVVNGVLTVDRSLVTYSGLDEEGWVGQDGFYGCLIPQYFHKAQTPISNIYKGVSPRDPADLQLGEFAQYSPTYNSINIKTNYASLSDFKTSLQSIPLTVLFEIKVPQIYTLSSTQIKSLLGVNNIFADTGKVDVQIWTKEV